MSTRHKNSRGGASHPPEGSGGTHSHSHGAVDPAILASRKGISAVKRAFLGLFATALFQIVIVAWSGSVALLADTIHNFGDAATAVPLWIAFRLSERAPSRRFTYGYGRVEDLAGVAIVLTIFASAVLSGYQSLVRFLHPQPVSHLWAVTGAALVGFLGNEAVARYRMKVGREIESAALVADGRHARADGLTSLSVLLGAAGAGAGFPVADPLVGLGITAAILRIVWQSGRVVFSRLVDGVDPEVIEEIARIAQDTPGVEESSEVRARWLGHRLQAEVNVAVDPALNVEQAHEIAREVRHRLLHRLRYLSDAVVHVDPATASGESHHRIESHSHDDASPHSH